MQSGILLLEPKNQDTHQSTDELVRQRFLSAGIAITTYDHGLLRASLPDSALATADLNRLTPIFRKAI
jgi:hypothetical protein